MSRNALWSSPIISITYRHGIWYWLTLLPTLPLRLRRAVAAARATTCCSLFADLMIYWVVPATKIFEGLVAESTARWTWLVLCPAATSNTSCPSRRWGGGVVSATLHTSPVGGKQDTSVWLYPQRQISPDRSTSVCLDLAQKLMALVWLFGIVWRLRGVDGSPFVRYM